MSHVGPRTPQSEAEITAIEGLLDRADAARGEPALDRARFARLHRSGGTSVAVWEPGGGPPVAYAQAEHTERRWEVELVVDPARRGEAPEVGAPALPEVLGGVRAAGGGQAYLWVSRPTDADDRMAEAAGFEPDRDLWQMVRPLPTELPYRLETRPFVVGKDEGPWVEVNNRAFDWHPEQGGWTVADVLAREAEPWFDAEGFLLHERDGRLAGFCWTKVHDRHDPPQGEIYVIAVDPDFAGLGLGRALTLAGLDHLAQRGLTVGMLYVDAGNTPAVRLYERLGFTVDHIDRAYKTDVAQPT